MSTDYLTYWHAAGYVRESLEDTIKPANDYADAVRYWC
jgi:hypothetical protein